MLFDALLALGACSPMRLLPDIRQGELHFGSPTAFNASHSSPFIPHIYAAHSPLSDTPREYTMRAQTEYLTRGRYLLSPGDYVNIAFSAGDGFIIVSEPAGLYYVNVATDCSSPGDRHCRWYHTTITRQYVLTGSSLSVAQITAITAGTFQITVGFFSAKCCEAVVARANGTWESVSWDVPALASNCFVQTVRTGTLTMWDPSIGDSQSILAYDFHSRQLDLTSGASGTVIDASSHIEAFVLDNEKGTGTFRFRFSLSVTDPGAVGLDLDVLPAWVATLLSRPSLMAGEAFHYPFALLANGGCAGVVCSEDATAHGGNTGGIPSTSDGDPVYEDLVPITTIVTIVLTIIILLSVAIGLVFFFWRKCRSVLVRRTDRPEEVPLDWNEEDDVQISYPPAPPAFASGPEVLDPYAVAKSDLESAYATPRCLPEVFDPSFSASPYGNPPITFATDRWSENA